MAGDRMISLADLESLLDELTEGDLEPEEAVVAANELAEAVVGFIAERSSGEDPPAEALDDVVDAASLAQQGYEDVGDRFGKGSAERDTLIQLSGYWETRAASARLEASVMRNRSAVLVGTPTTSTPTSPLQAASTKADGSATPADLTEVSPKSGLGALGSGGRRGKRSGSVPTRQGRNVLELGSGEHFKEAIAGIARRSGRLGLDDASIPGKGTDPNAGTLGVDEAPSGKESDDD
jgi:hypothetical protein